MASRTRWCFLSGLENGIPVLSIQREREGEGRREICEGTLHQSKGEYKLIVCLMVLTISTLSSGDGRAGRAMTNMKHLSPTPPTGHLTPGQKEGDNYHQMVQEKWFEKCPKTRIFKLVLSTSSTQGTHHDQMSSGEYLITLPFRFTVYLKPHQIKIIHPLIYCHIFVPDNLIS